jgi:hypothetical protein
MKPRIQCVLTQWIPGFTVSGTHPREPETPTAREPSATP